MKVAVVGGGFSGLAFARKFRDCEVFNMGFTGTTGALSIPTIHEYNCEEFLRDEFVLWRFRSIKVDFFGEVIEEDFDRDVGLITDVKGMIDFLKEGVNYINKHITLNDFAEIVKKYDYVVSAGGVFSVGNKYLGLKHPERDDLHIGVQVDVKSRDEKRDVEVYVNELAPKGYVWCMRIDDDKYRVGFGVPKYLGINLHDRLKEVLKHTFTHYEALTKPYGGYIPTTKPLKRFKYGNIFLVGDSLHLCDPITGGGIVYALASGVDVANYLNGGRVKYIPKIKSMLNMRYHVKQVVFGMDVKKLKKLFEIVVKDVLGEGKLTPFRITKILMRYLMEYIVSSFKKA